MTSKEKGLHIKEILTFTPKKMGQSLTLTKDEDETEINTVKLFIKQTEEELKK